MNSRYLNTVEAYTPSTNNWTTLAPMPTARAFLAAATGLDGRIYAIGGYDNGNNNFNTVEAYTPSTDNWITVAPMPTNRHTLAAATGLDGRIYAIGGYSYSNSAGSLNTTEVYTPTSTSTNDTGGTTTPELDSGELLATGLLPIVAVLLYRRRRERRTQQDEPLT